MHRVVMGKVIMSIQEIRHIDSDTIYPGEAWITFGPSALPYSGWIDNDEVVKAICHGWLA
jgi:hypothetical protein